MKRSLFLLLLFLTYYSFGQNLYNANWCFQKQAGLDFNLATYLNPPSPFQSVLNYTNPGNSYGCASVSDENGQLRFYTDGINVWGADNLLIQNGTGLDGYSDYGILQKVVIVPKPGDANSYYIFTIGSLTQHGYTGSFVGKGGIHYSVVEFDAFGHGQVTFKNIALKNKAGTLLDYDFDYNHTEDNPIFLTNETRMTTALHKDGDKVWVTIIPDFYYNGQHTRKYYAFLVTANGISGLPDGSNSAPLVETFLNPANYNVLEYSVSAMKISPNNQYLCDAEDVVNLYQFNNTTGTLGTVQRIFTPTPYNQAPVGYGIEFSPDNSHIYITYLPDGILQNITAKGGEGSRTVPGLYQYGLDKEQLELIYPFSNTGTSDGYIPIAGPNSFGLQRAIDNKIYVCIYPSTNIGVINDPNDFGTNCNYNPIGYPLSPGTEPGLMLPQWVQKPAPPIVNEWPKIYEAYTGPPDPQTITLSDGRINGSTVTGNLYASVLGNLSNNINHHGAIPPVEGPYLMQYKMADGNSTWYNSNETVVFSLNNGNIQALQASGQTISTVFRSGLTGVQVAAPATSPAIQSNEIIVAEDNGNYIVKNGTGIRIRSASGESLLYTPPLSFDAAPIEVKYNPTSTPKKLFVIYPRIITLNQAANIVVIYDVDLSARTLTIDRTFSPTGTIGFSELLQVNSNNDVFLNSIQNLYKYDYAANLYGIYTPPGVNNNHSIWGRAGANPNVDDEIIAVNQDDNEIYYIDTKLDLVKKIPFISPCTGCTWFKYYKNGNDLYLNGGFEGATTLQIGTQTIALPTSTLLYAPSFVTRFDLAHDFSRSATDIDGSRMVSTQQPQPLLSAILSPNPAKNILQIKIDDKLYKAGSWYNISITNNYGISLKKMRTQKMNESINISTLPTGSYYLLIINDKGERVSRTFIKE